MRRQLLLLVVFSIPALAWGQTDRALRDQPGFLDLATIDGWFNREAKIEVNVSGALLGLIQGATQNEEPELSSMLGRLKGLYVRGYSVEPGEVRSIADRTGALARSLSSRGWETVVRVREDDERIDVYLRTVQDRIAGLVVMVVGEDETMFVNIVGEIDPSELGRLGSRFNLNLPNAGR